MKWFKKLFGLKEKEEEDEEVILQDLTNLKIQEEEEWQECFFCKNPIYKSDKWSKQLGKYYHRKCYKQMLSGF